MIDIKDIQGNIILTVPVTQGCKKVEELMTSDYIELSWNSDSHDEIPVGSYIEHEDEIYRLLDPYKPVQKSEVEYVYTPQFKSKVMAWGKMPFFFYSEQSKEPDWTLTGNPADFMKAVCDSILNETGEEWTYTIDASLPASASLSFSSTDILSALNEMASAFDTEWIADKANKIIHFGMLSHGEEVTLEVGVNVNVPTVQNSKDGYYTRFYAFGSTRNITQDYEGAGANNLVNKRLTLDPAKYPDGYKDIREDLGEGEIYSKILIFDEVYPSADLAISGVRNRLMYRLDANGDKVQVGTDDSGSPIYDQYAIWYFRIEGFDFDVSNIIEGYNLSISFQSGALSGREFELKYYERDTIISTSDGLTFEAKAGDYEILFVEESSYIIPSLTGLIPSDGDHVVLFNIKMPSEYTQSAYTELETELDKAIKKMTSDMNNYTFKSNPIAFNEENPNLSIGRNVKYVNGAYWYHTRVLKRTTQLDYPIEQEITIGNTKVKGNTQQLKEEVANANSDLNLLAVFNDMTNSIQQSYNRTQQMMLEGFAAIKNIWQLKKDKNGNQYAWSAFNVVTQQGITMYADASTLQLPSIYDGLPIDGETLYWEEVTDGDGNVVRTLKSKGGGEASATTLGGLTNVGAWADGAAGDDRIMVQLKGSDVWTAMPLADLSGGTASFENVALSGDGNAVTSFEVSDDKLTLTLVKGGTFVTKTDFDTLSNKVTDFLEGSDTDTIINKWKELETFLEGMSESDDLADILSKKWTADATKISNWDAAYSWGDHSKQGYAKTAYVDGNFVTIGTAQTVTGRKDFTEGGLCVNGSQIEYDKSSGCWKLTGDLLVTGGVTMYYDNGTTDYPTVASSLPFDGTTIWYNPDTKVIEVIGGTGGGVADSVAWEDVTGKPTFATVATSGSYNDLINKPTIPTSLKNPYALTFGSKTYDGSAAKTITASDLGALTSHQTIYSLTVKNSSGTTQVTYTPNSGSASLTLTKAMVGLGDVENTALSTWTGSTKLTTLGTITTGTWHGSDITNDYLANSSIAVNGKSVSLGGSVDLYIGKTKAQTSSAVQSLTGIGNITPGANNSYTLGTSSSMQWNAVYAKESYIDGIRLYKSASGVLFLDGNLVVSGGVTMYATDGSASSSVMDGIAVDGVTISKEKGYLEVIGGTGGGIDSLTVKVGSTSYTGTGTTDVVVSLPAYPTSLKNPYSLTINGTSYDGSAAKTVNITAASLGALTGITSSMVTDALGYTPLQTHQTIYNLKMQAGAFSAVTFDPNGAAQTVKIPTTTSHISEGSNLYFTNARAVSALTDTLKGYVTALGTSDNYLTWTKGGVTSNITVPFAAKTYRLQAYASITDLNLPSSYESDGTRVVYDVGNNSITNIPDDVKPNNANGLLTLYKGKHATDGQFMSQLYFPDTTDSIYARRSASGIYYRWHQIAFTDSDITGNAATATKLKTARKIWGQSFDGTSNINGHLYLEGTKATGSTSSTSQIVLGTSSTQYCAVSGVANALVINPNTSSTTGQTYLGVNGAKTVFLSTGNFGIGTSSPEYKLHVAGTGFFGDDVVIDGNLLVKGGVTMYATTEDSGLANDFLPNATNTYNLGSDTKRWLSLYVKDINMTGDLSSGYVFIRSSISTNPYLRLTVGSLLWYVQAQNSYLYVGAASSKALRLDQNGNGYLPGTLTQGSDVRYKTVHGDMVLGLQQMADAPSFEYHFTEDESGRTHIGTSAQYWQSVNGVVTENEDGRLGMDYSSLGVVMGISLAKELLSFESEAERRISALEAENEALRKEIDELKQMI